MKMFRFLTVSVLFPAKLSGKQAPAWGGALLAPGWVCFLVTSNSFFFFFKGKKSGGLFYFK